MCSLLKTAYGKNGREEGFLLDPLDGDKEEGGL
jgi:hypothetical protein